MDVLTQTIIEDGTRIEHYPCDMNENGDLCSNGSIEEVWEYKGQRYYLHKTWEDVYFGSPDPVEKEGE